MDLGTVMRATRKGGSEQPQTEQQQQQQQQPQQGEKSSAVSMDKGAAAHVDETENEDDYPILPPREVVEELRGHLGAYFASMGMAACRELCGLEPGSGIDAPPFVSPPLPSGLEAVEADDDERSCGRAEAGGPSSGSVDLGAEERRREGPRSPFTAAASTAAPWADQMHRHLAGPSTTAAVVEVGDGSLPLPASGLRRRTARLQREQEEQGSAPGSAGAGQQLPGAVLQPLGWRLPGAGGVVRLGSKARRAVQRLGGWLNGGPESGSEDFHIFRAKREQQRGLAGACGLLLARGAFFTVQALSGKGGDGEEQAAAAAAGEMLAALLWVASSLVLLLGALLLGRLQGRARWGCGQDGCAPACTVVVLKLVFHAAEISKISCSSQAAIGACVAHR